MAVHKRGYQRYQGPLTGRWTRLMWLPRFAWQTLMQERLLTKIFMVALVWPAASLFFESGLQVPRDPRLDQTILPRRTLLRRHG